MDVNAQFMSDTAERRRTQNRLAQRKFRGKWPFAIARVDSLLIGIATTEKKRRVAGSAVLQASHTQNGAFRAPSQSTLANNGDFSLNSLSSFPSAPGLTGSLSPNEIPIASTEPGPVENFDMDAIDQFLYEMNNDFLFFSDSVPVQSSLTGPNLTQSKTLNAASPNTSSNNITNNNSKLLSRPADSPRLPLHRRTSESDIRPESPGPQLPKSPSDDTVLELITSARSDKGWIGTLHIAAQKGHERIVRILLLRGNMDANKQDSDGRTPLIHAIIENHHSVVRLLLSHGARLGVYDCDGRSALHWAVLHRRLEILQQLLDHRAKYEPSLDLDVYDNAGWTPLHMCVDRAFEAGILMLLQEGADIDAKAQKCPYTGMIVPLMDGQR
ncbi:Bicupin oxalate decarboxylase/oxidase [Penicillium cf. griseofulvum]|uniref:Bicupin oxalate decarboxylase/oxidase n=1 Tax=Penicillium cf. griseofulvum TaxID=2972120 RepID=A0A9W9J7W5_9EURO|nr:Bicupin oxalate decarboxylase/oxidase [Penicillium cf. griseofulvum]KAJ5427602.1 Bicupin oxalate decarboxylase/oxidase [Penicillium cf. griseofulvum]KAJ5431799.1 Bicupin oxalate decarboxylase/oxidase [Penicillium cf. griseofulvum]